MKYIWKKNNCAYIFTLKYTLNINTLIIKVYIVRYLYYLFLNIILTF